MNLKRLRILHITDVSVLMPRTRGLLSTKLQAIRVTCNAQDLRIGVRRSRVVLVPLQLSPYPIFRTFYYTAAGEN